MEAAGQEKKNTGIQWEREKMVVGNNEMDISGYKDAQMYRWLLMFAHYLGYTQYIFLHYFLTYIVFLLALIALIHVLKMLLKSK